MQREILPIRDVDSYSNRYLYAGALIPETIEMLGAVSIGSTAEGVRKRMSSGTLLGQHSQIARENIWEWLNERFFVRQAEWVVPELVEAFGAFPDSADLLAILYLQYVLRDHLTYDLVTQAIWSRWSAGERDVGVPDGLELLDRAESAHPIVCRWSEGSRVQLVDKIFASLVAFGLLAESGVRWRIVPDLPSSAARYLLRVLHAEALQGDALVDDAAWRVLLYDREAVDEALSDLRDAGIIELRSGDDGVHIEVPSDWW